jgi:hypothetical protein
MKYVSISPEELESLYRCISLAMDWRDAFDEGLVEEKGWDKTTDHQTKRDWLSKHIAIASGATSKIWWYNNFQQYYSNKIKSMSINNG